MDIRAGIIAAIFLSVISAVFVFRSGYLAWLSARKLTFYRIKRQRERGRAFHYPDCTHHVRVCRPLIYVWRAGRLSIFSPITYDHTFAYDHIISNHYAVSDHHTHTDDYRYAVCHRYAHHHADTIHPACHRSHFLERSDAQRKRRIQPASIHAQLFELQRVYSRNCFSKPDHIYVRRVHV